VFTEKVLPKYLNNSFFSKILTIFTITTLVVLIVLSPAVHAHAIRAKILNTTEYVWLKVKVYFPGTGPAKNIPVNIYSPECKEYTLCPPECTPFMITKTDSDGYVEIMVPKVEGIWIVAAIADPAHRVCKRINISKTGVMITGSESIEMPEPLLALAGIGYFLGIAGIAMIIISKRRTK